MQTRRELAQCGVQISAVHSFDTTAESLTMQPMVGGRNQSDKSGNLNKLRVGTAVDKPVDRRPLWGRIKLRKVVRPYSRLDLGS